MRTMNNIKELLKEQIKFTDGYLDKYLAEKNNPQNIIYKAMRYSVFAGGKRLRPILMMNTCKMCGGDVNEVIPFACALEMIHTYSLIHDDLPCMDNDDLRRGRPSCHIKFGEANALLAGDALLTDAFAVALSTEGVDPSNVVKAASVLSECSGSRGMIGGQVIDLKYEDKSISLDAVTEMYYLKTSMLLIAAAKIGCILGGGDRQDIAAAGTFAKKLGLAFQIRDDILDLTGTAEELGKPLGSDDKSHKSTYVSHVGLDKAQHDVNMLTAEALSQIDRFGSRSDRLREYALALCERKN